MSADAPLAAEPLPELARLTWRPRADAQRLRRVERLWTISTVAQALPLVATTVLLGAMNPITLPVGVILLVHAWMIPSLYARRGLGVVRRRAAVSDPGAQRVALGLLGDLVGHQARDLHGRTGLVLERGSLGCWLVGEAGALLVRHGGRRVNCYCAGVADPELPPADRIAHLLLALRADEWGFVTVANLSFSGALWRLRRRLSALHREALAAAARAARGRP